jgi:hypothetical protein
VWPEISVPIPAHELDGLARIHRRRVAHETVVVISRIGESFDVHGKIRGVAVSSWRKGGSQIE